MPAFKDHSGEKYGKWTILNRLLPNRPAKYLCKCDCGNESEVFLTNLTRGNSENCRGCQSFKWSSYLIGKKFNHLEIISLKKIKEKTVAEVLCDCGNTTYLEPHKIQKVSGKRIAANIFPVVNAELENQKLKTISQKKLDSEKEC